MKSPKTNIFLIIVISVVSGLLAGFFGCFLFLVLGKIKIPFLGNLERYFPEKEITISTQEKITVTRDVLIAELLKEFKKQLVKIVLVKKKSDNVLADAYTDKDILGSGFILTNDGWIISTETGIKDASGKYLVLMDDGQSYPVEKIIKDTFSGAVFLKISAFGSPVANLGGQEDLILGQEVLVFDKSKTLMVGFLSRIRYCPSDEKKDLVRNTEKFCDFLLIDKNLNNNFNGSALINLDKTVIGIINKNNQIIPSYYFKNLINQILKTGKIEKPYLGIDYIELADIFGLEKNGILIYKIAKNSPSIKAGLKEGDSIIKIDNKTINRRATFFELLQDYKKGDSMELTILREGKERVVDLKL